MPKNLINQGWVYALLAVTYVSTVATLLQNANWIFGSLSPKLGPIVFLLLLVLSAATMALLFAGRPTLLYLEGRKPEAVRLVFSTFAYFTLFTVVLTATLLLLGHL